MSDKLEAFAMQQAQEERVAQTVARLVRESEAVRAKAARLNAYPFLVLQRLDGKRLKFPEC